MVLSNDKIPFFLKRKDDALLFNGDGQFIFYVPETYFDSKNAIIVGDYVNILGILNYSIENKTGGNGGLRTFNFPTVFLTKPTTIDKVKDVKLTKTTPSQDYRLLKYNKGDMVVVSTKVPQDIVNVEDFYRLFVITGNIPNTIPYDKLQDYFIESMTLNGASYGISLQMFGILLSELCRSVKDESIPFRLAKEKDMTNYRPVSIKVIPKLISPYSAITSENWDEAVVNAIINKGDKTSPMEKILMT